MDCDIAIFGAGPSCCALACLAAKNGLRVCLIDKARFPRDKLCGGLLTLRSKVLFERIFGRAWDASLITTSDRVVMYSQNKFPDGISQPSPLYLTMRYEFDACLLDMAGAAGADIKTGLKVVSFDFDANMLVLSSGESVAYRYLVGADGVNSQVAKLIFGQSFNRDKIGFALEVEVPRSDLPKQDDVVEIDMAASLWGYGWTFPKTNSFTIGVGGLRSKNPDMKKNLSRYMARKGLDMKHYRVKGHFLSTGDFRAPPGKGNIILVGDAAGLGDPLTGEGIANALQSGEAAATALTGAIMGGTAKSALQSYQSEYKKITATIKYARVLCWLIYPRKIRTWLAGFYSGSGSLQRGYLAILSGELEYKALFPLFAAQALNTLKRLPLKLLGMGSKEKP